MKKATLIHMQLVDLTLLLLSSLSLAVFFSTHSHTTHEVLCGAIYNLAMYFGSQFLLFLYTLYSKLTGASPNQSNWSNWLSENESGRLISRKNKKSFDIADDDSGAWGECVALREAEADINTKEVFSKFEFEPDWMKTKEYWDDEFETRYERQMKDPERPPLKVFVVPHSHNDPGWLKTFVNYFQSDTKNILNMAMTKLPVLHNMSFIWSEISFLNMWWEQAHPSKQRQLKKLVEEGRLEITTGGWVMTDEANSHMFAMLDQLIEGHQWVKTNLNVIPKSGWSIDPFGHGSTVPYFLASSGFEGTIIQRIHYSWKQVSACIHKARYEYSAILSQKY